jgi:hypothetical protein
MVLENWKVRMDYVLPAVLLSVELKGRKYIFLMNTPTMFPQGQYTFQNIGMYTVPYASMTWK